MNGVNRRFKVQCGLICWDFRGILHDSNLASYSGSLICLGIWVYLGAGVSFLGEDRILKLEIWGDHIQTWAFVLIGCVFVTSGLGICFSHLLRYTKKKKKNPFKLITNCNSEMNLDGNLELKANKTYRTELKRSKLIKLNWILTKLKGCNM